MQEKKRMEKRKKKFVFEEETQRETATVGEVQTLETTKQLKEVIPEKPETAEKVMPVQESVEISTTQTVDKADDFKSKLTQLRKIVKKPAQQPVQQPVQVTQVQPEWMTKKLTRRKSEETKAQQTVTLKESVSVSQVAAQSTVKEFKTEETTEKAKRIAPVQESITVTQTTTSTDSTVKELKRPEKPKEKAKRIAPIQEPVSVSETTVESTIKEFKPEKITEKAKKIVPVQESVSVSQMTSESTIKEFKTETTTEKAKRIAPVQESVSISEMTTESTVKEFKPEKTIEKAKRIVPVQESVSISEIQTEASVKELPEKKPKVRHAKIDKKPELETATVTEVRTQRVEQILKTQETKMANEVEELMKFVKAKEFGPGETPLRELGKIGYLVRQGVSVNEITTLYEADHFPSLRTPEAQSAMVQLVEREGHGALVSQVLTEENTVDEDVVAATVGFRAFMRMVELKHAAVEQIITHFAPEDFRPHAWETSEATEIVTKDVMQRAQVTEQQAEMHVEETRVNLLQRCMLLQECKRVLLQSATALILCAVGVIMLRLYVLLQEF